MHTIDLHPGRRYYPASLRGDLSFLEDAGSRPHTAVAIPLGRARYGGPVMDLPPGFALPPERYRFAAQLDLAALAPYDDAWRLPPSGYLYFFFDALEDEVLVHYADVTADRLERVTVEHEGMFFEGVLIERYSRGTDDWAAHYYPNAGDDSDGDEGDGDDGDDDETGWDESAGADRSKVFGILTHVQWEEDDIRAEMQGSAVLLQIGENGFNDEGVFSVLVDEAALARRDFSEARGYWSQT